MPLPRSTSALSGSCLSGLQPLLKISNGLYLHSPDRLARKYAYQVLLLDELQRAGVNIVFLNPALGDSPEDDLLLQVQAMVTEYERAMIFERRRCGKRHATHWDRSIL